MVWLRFRGFNSAFSAGFCSADSGVKSFVLGNQVPLIAKFAKECSEATEKNYFQMPVIGVALRSFAVRGSSPKLSSIVRSTL